jgi:5-(carboxyamino)imidazole ribonucleotide synthase
MDPNKNAPCNNIADEFIVGNLNDYNDVINFGKLVDIITIEIENVNTDALEYLEKIGKKVYPPSRAIKIIQNKCEQKAFYKSNNLPTSAFTNYSSLYDLKEDLKKENLKFPFVWKSAKFGYDGKGVKIIRNHDDLKSINDGLCLIEEKVSIKKEISVIVSRNVEGKMKCFPVVEMEFNNDSNLVEYVMCPANISHEIASSAYEIAQNISQKLEMVGLLAVELFISEDGKILINEVAPRPHNSGHHTIECCITSQFDQHIRSILNLNPGKTDIKIPGIMVNLVGENIIEGDAIYKNINHIFDFPGVNIHIYGKKKSRLNRKMGHITIVNKEISKAIEIGKKIKKKIKVTS